MQENIAEIADELKQWDEQVERQLQSHQQDLEHEGARIRKQISDMTTKAQTSISTLLQEDLTLRTLLSNSLVNGRF